MVMGLPRRGSNGEPGHPALVLDTELAGAIDAALPDAVLHQTVDARVVQRTGRRAHARWATVGIWKSRRLVLADAIRSRCLLLVAAIALTTTGTLCILP